jgi:predicted heme/steroid binding protein
MNSSDLYDRFRTDVFDTAEPYLWTDGEVFAYMDAAQKQFCRLSGGIKDASSALTQVPIVATEAWVTYDPRILKITRANRLSDFRKVEVMTIESLESVNAADDYGIASAYTLDNIQGAVQAIVTNLEDGKIRLVRVPKENDTLQLAVYRLPLVTINDTDMALEIDEQHHEYLLLWMKKLAYSKQDAETRDDKKAAANELAFRAYCEQARAERERREHKARPMAYGGI